MSTKTGIAPTSTMTSPTEMNVRDSVITSSPGPMPAAIIATWSAAKPELTATPCLTPMYAQNSSSKRPPSLSFSRYERIMRPSSSARTAAAFISSVMIGT